MAGKTFAYTISAVDKATATLDRINRKLDKIGSPFRALAKSSKALSDASGLTKLSNNLGDVAKQADKAARSLTKMAAPLLAIVGGGTIAGLSEMVTHWERVGAETERTSRMLGITANQLTQMRGAANLMGVASDEMAAGFQSLQDTLQDARWGRNQGAFATLQALGIRLKSTKDGVIDTKAAMYDLADRLQRIQRRDPAAARNLARSLGVEKLLPMLVQGRQAMQQFEAAAQRLRGDFTPEMARRAQGFVLSLSRLGEATDGLKASIADRLTPVIQPLLDRFTEWIAKNRDLLGQDVAKIVQRIADALANFDWDKFSDDVSKAIGATLGFIGALAKAIDFLGGVKAVAVGVALYFGGGFLVSIVSTVAKIGGVLMRFGALAWANPIVVEIGVILAALGALAYVVYRVLKYFHLLSGVTSTIDSIAGKIGNLFGSGDDKAPALPGMPAPQDESQNGGASDGSSAQPGEYAGKSASVAQWAKHLDFAGLEKRYGLQSGLLAGVAQVESRGNAAAVSPAGAAGLFQFMPSTAREYGINALDPAQSADAAAKKLSGLMKRYNGNLSAALSAYNWGEGNVDRKGLANAPAETRAYVPKVLAAMGANGSMFAGAPMPPLNAPPPQQATTAPPVVHVNTRVHVERDGRTSVRTETPSGLHVAYPSLGMG